MKEASKVKTTHHISELMEVAYNVARESFGSQFFSFANIWSKVWKSAEGFSKERVENWIGFFYAELLTDPRFVVFSFNKLRLKEYMDFDEVKKLEKTVFSDDSVFEEEYESYMAEKSKKDVEVIVEASADGEMAEEDMDDKVVDGDEEDGESAVDKEEEGEEISDETFEEDL